MTEKIKKENSPEHSELAVINYVQIGLIQRYLKRELGDLVSANPKIKLKYENDWLKEYAPAFREIFNTNKKEFLQMYGKDRDGLIVAVEKELENPR